MKTTFLTALLCLQISVYADGGMKGGFDSSYAQLQKKIEELQAGGKKVSAETKQELERLMVQLNHEHTQLRRELELKDQELKQKVESGKSAGSDWTARFNSALHEVDEGFERAWNKLKKSGEQ